MKYTIPLLCIAATLSSCGPKEWEPYGSGRLITAAGRTSQERYVKAMCAQESMVGEVDSVETILNLKRQELSEASATLTAQKSTTLGQTLAGYSADWQFAQNQLNQQCRIYAACRWVKQEHGPGCRGEKESFDAAQVRVSDLISKINATKISE